MKGRIIIPGRPDFKDSKFGITYAKKFPPYVYGLRGLSCLIHKVIRMEIHWWRACYDHMEQLDPPVLIAITACSQSFRLNNKWATTCALPDPKATLCGRCHGKGPTFSRDDPDDAKKRRAARANLGCIVDGQ